MTMKPGSIQPGLGLGAATFFTLLALPYDNASALWWAMAGLCGLTLLLTILTAGSGNRLGILSLAVASVIVLATVAEFGTAKTGVDPADHPLAFAVFLAVIIGFPLGVLAVSDAFLEPLPALLAGLAGVIYMPLPMWLSVELGLTDYMIDVFDPRMHFGHLLGLEGVNIGWALDLLGMAIAGGITLLIFSLPALPVVLVVRTLIGRS